MEIKKDNKVPVTAGKPTEGTSKTRQTDTSEASVFAQTTPTKNLKQNILANALDDKNSDWKDVEPKKNGLISRHAYSYKIDDGTQISLDNIDDVVVKFNPNTSEILVFGAQNATIKGSSKDNTIVVVDSTVKSIDLKDGNDSLIVCSSDVDGKIVMNDGINQVIIADGSNINDSIETGNNEDYIIVDDSKINGINSGKGDNFISVANSTVSDINSNGGSDDVVITDGTVVSNLNLGQGDDIVELENSVVDKFDSNKGDDKVILDENSDILTADDDMVISKIADVDEYTDADINAALSVSDAIASLYGFSQSTSEEQFRAITIDNFTQSLNSIKQQFDSQNNEDGAIIDGYNVVKELLDLGVSKEDIEAAIDEQQGMIDELQAAANGDSDLSFEEVYKKWTGLDYNEENISQYVQYSKMYSMASSALAQIDNFSTSLKEADNMQDVYQLYVDFYQDETKARQMLNSSLSYLPELPSGFDFASEMYIDEDNELHYKSLDSLNYGAQRSDKESGLADFANIFGDDYFNNMSNYVTKQLFEDNFKDSCGLSIEELQAQYANSQLKAFGCANSFQNLVDNYCKENDEFAKKVSQAMQVSALGLIATGSAVVIACPAATPIATTMMGAGKNLAFCAMLSDNAIELGDNLLSENGLTKDEAYGLAKDTMVDLLLYYSGRNINTVSQAAHEAVLSATQSNAIGWLAEIGSDAAMSILADAMITGDVDFTGEGFSQLLGILTGIAGAKVTDFQEKLEVADGYFKNNDANGGYDYLKSQGFSDRQIYKQFSVAEIENLAAQYRNDHSLDNLFASLENSKILQYDFDASKTALMQSCKGYEKTNIFKLMAEGADFGTIKDYINKTGLFTPKDTEYFQVNYEGRQIAKQMSEYIDIYSDFLDVDYDFSTNIGKAVKSDLELFLKAKKEGIDPKDLEVKSFSSIDEAKDAIEVGDVFEVEGEKFVYMKTESGDCKQLQMSKDKYCDLFPLVGRYASYQGATGDCYAVSPIFSLMANPDTRYQMYSCIKENSDGSLTINLPGSKAGDFEIGANETLFGEKYGVEHSKISVGCSGVQLLEYVCRRDLYIDKSHPEASGVLKDIALQESTINMLLRHSEVAKSGSAANIDELETPIKEFAADFCKKYGIADIDADKLFDIASKADSVSQSEKASFDEYLKQVLNTDDMNLIDEFKESVLSHYADIAIYRCYSQLDKYKASFGNTYKKHPVYNYDTIDEVTTGGTSDQVFKLFGFKNCTLAADDSSLDSFIETLKTQQSSFTDGKMLTAGSKRTKEQVDALLEDPKSKLYKSYHGTESQRKSFERYYSKLPDVQHPKISQNHCHALDIIYEGSQPLFRITNPHGIASRTPQTYVLTEDEFKKYFDNVCYIEL